MPLPLALGRSLVALRVACPTSWWACCLNYDNCQPEAASDVISGAVVDPTGDSRSNRSREIRLPRFVTNDRTTAVADRDIKQQDGHQLLTQAKFGPKPSEAAFSAVFSNIDICRPEVAGDVITGVSVE